MKILFLIGVIVQSLAENTVTKVVQPPNDKLYPIFDLIASKMQEHSIKQYMWLAGMANELLPEYTAQAHNTTEHKVLIEGYLQAFSSVEALAKDPENCRLQRAAYIDTMAISGLRSADDHFNVFFSKLNIPFELGVNNAIRDISKQFPDLIKNFMESLTEEEKKNNPELYRAAEAILKAAGLQEKFSAIQSFMREAHYDKNLTEANDENCKWDLTNFDGFVMDFLNNTDYVETD